MQEKEKVLVLTGGAGVSGKDGLGQHLGIVLAVSPQPYPKIGAWTLNSALGSSRTAVRGSGVTLSM
jgi:hypothetical protein